jgi:flagellar assembly protein FliH
MPLIKRVHQNNPPPPDSRGTASPESLPPWLDHVVQQQYPAQRSTESTGHDSMIEQLVWEDTPTTALPTPHDLSQLKRRATDHEPPFHADAFNQEAVQDAFQKGFQQGLEQGQEQGYQYALEQATHQAQEQGYQAGFEQGKADGFQQGYTQGMAEAEESAQEIWSILDQLETVKNKVLEKSVQDIVPMAMAIAQRLIKVEVSCDRHLVVGLALDVLGKVDRTQKEVVFKVNPQDVQLLRQHIKDNEETWQGEVQRHYIVVGDDHVDLGSCIVETSGGQIDASFKTQLKMIRKLLGLPNVATTEKEASESEFDHLLNPEENTPDWQTPFEA